MILPLIEPFRMLVIGCSQSGKSTFASEIIKRKNHSITNPPDIVIYCAKYFSSVPNDIRHLVKFHEGIPTADIFEMYENKRILLIYDDLQIDGLNSNTTAEIFLFGRHSKISVIFLQHNIFPRQRVARDISLNASYIVLMKTTRDPSQVMILSRQIVPLNPLFLSKIYFENINSPYSHLLIDLCIKTPDFLRFRTNIFSDMPAIFVDENGKKKLENFCSESSSLTQSWPRLITI